MYACTVFLRGGQFLLIKQAIFPVDVRPLHGLGVPLVCLSIQLPLVHKP